MGKNFWDKDYGWDRLYTSFEAAPGETTVFVGVLRSAGVYKSGENVSVAQIAAIHEFGAKDGKHPPERSFMRSSIDANSNQLRKIITKLILKVTDKKLTTVQALGVVGQFVRDKMVAKINSGVPPGLAPSTIAAKGSSKPLIDTGQLKSSLDWEVHEGKNVSR